jgi:hypothetical protein
MLTKCCSSGVVSTFFLWMMDVDKSRIECEEFVLAEEKRKAFETTLGHVNPTTP